MVNLLQILYTLHNKKRRNKTMPINEGNKIKTSVAISEYQKMRMKELIDRRMFTSVSDIITTALAGLFTKIDWHDQTDYWYERESNEEQEARKLSTLVAEFANNPRIREMIATESTKDHPEEEKIKNTVAGLHARKTRLYIKDEDWV